MNYKNKGPPKRSFTMRQTGICLPDVFNKFLYQTIYLFRSVCIGIMPGSFNPLQRNFALSMPCFVIPYARTGVVLCSAYQQSRTVQFIRQVLFHCRCQNTKTMSGNLRITLLVSVIDQHHFAHQTFTIIGSCNTLGSLFQKQLPWVARIHWLHSFQKPKFSRCHKFSLQRCRVDGNKTGQPVRIKLCISLSHISAHRLTDYHRLRNFFPFENFIQPFCLIKQIKVKLERP